ncbi:hypothetical protein FA13DRAFT_1796999 [Coprinellus micaceus]|uniref:Uncharacterized protein n=1 Tax=Coprinellus micaceus TaxID=71717 RepID=A0A4Y7SSH5_COPMI|nr:hypothetical protein FA13DRAFT_1796999 [Coprinellus micaceus]
MPPRTKATNDVPRPSTRSVSKSVTAAKTGASVAQTGKLKGKQTKMATVKGDLSNKEVESEDESSTPPKLKRKHANSEAVSAGKSTSLAGKPRQKIAKSDQGMEHYKTSRKPSKSQKGESRRKRRHEVIEESDEDVPVVQRPKNVKIKDKNKKLVQSDVKDHSSSSSDDPVPDLYSEQELEASDDDGFEGMPEAEVMAMLKNEESRIVGHSDDVDSDLIAQDDAGIEMVERRMSISSSVELETDPEESDMSVDDVERDRKKAVKPKEKKQSGHRQAKFDAEQPVVKKEEVHAKPNGSRNGKRVEREAQR